MGLFSFAKVVCMHLTKAPPPGMDDIGPGSCHAYATALFRMGVASGAIDIPNPEKTTIKANP